MIRVAIVDDEAGSRDFLLEKLQVQFPELNVAGIYVSVEEAARNLPVLKPDLVFLDVEMPPSTGFDLLRQLPSVHFEIIFTTAHAKYALQAIRFSALDYLLKPFTTEDLTQAMQRFYEKRNQPSSLMQYELLLENLKHAMLGDKKIALPTATGLIFIHVKDIVRCEAQVNYTQFYLRNKEKILVSRTLKEYETMLEELDFFRAHNSSLINLHYVKSYQKGEGGVTMEDGSEVIVARRKKDDFLKKITGI